MKIVHESPCRGAYPAKRVFPKGAVMKPPKKDYFVVVLYEKGIVLYKQEMNANRHDRIDIAIKKDSQVGFNNGDFVFENYWHAYAYYQKICKWRRENGA